MSSTILRPIPADPLSAGRRATPAKRSGTEAGSGAARPWLRRGVTVLGTALLMLAAVVFCFLAIGPRVLGYQTSTMLTGSMAPGINPGDVVVSVPTPVGQLKVGDVITYGIPVEDHRVETHRIVDVVHNPNGTTAVRTKGDANNGVDPWTATLDGQTAHRQVATIPHLGSLIRTLRTPVAHNLLMYGAPTVLVLGLLTSIWRREPDSDTAEARDRRQS